MSAVIVAIIAGCVALVVAYVNTILAESYRRFRDGSALAASLAGELGAYETAWPTIKKMLDRLSAIADADPRPASLLRPFERPKDLVYESAIGKLGLLDSRTAEGVVFVYSNIGAFRLAFEIICRHESDMTGEELRARCASCIAALERAVSRGAELLPALRERANQPFVTNWPEAAWNALRGRFPV